MPWPTSRFPRRPSSNGPDLEHHFQQSLAVLGQHAAGLAATGQWRDGKDTAAYTEATLTAATETPDLLHALLENVRRPTLV